MGRPGQRDVRRHVAVTPSVLSAAIEGELAALSDSRVLDHIRSLLIAPREQLRPWDYGTPNQEFPCWIVLEHKRSDTAVAFCEFGFGPKNPWGLLALDREHGSIGMDSGWFERFLDAYFESFAASDLEIWRVFESPGSTCQRRAVSAEGSWDHTWAEVMRLRKAHPESRFDCGQSVYVRDA